MVTYIHDPPVCPARRGYCERYNTFARRLKVSTFSIIKRRTARQHALSVAIEQRRNVPHRCKSLLAIDVGRLFLEELFNGDEEYFLSSSVLFFTSRRQTSCTQSLQTSAYSPTGCSFSSATNKARTGIGLSRRELSSSSVEMGYRVSATWCVAPGQ